MLMKDLITQFLLFSLLLFSPYIIGIWLTPSNLSILALPSRKCVLQKIKREFVANISFEICVFFVFLGYKINGIFSNIFELDTLLSKNCGNIIQIRIRASFCDLRTIICNFIISFMYKFRYRNQGISFLFNHLYDFR